MELNNYSDIDRLPQISDDTKFPKTRQILGFLGFLGFANAYAMRVNLSVAIVAMVNHTAIPSIVENITESCQNTEFKNGTFPMIDGPFVWDERIQGIVLGSFFYGYVLTQIPGGRLAEIFGGKHIFGYGILITAIFTILTPIIATVSLRALIIVRIMVGVGEGVTFPSMHAMLARWVPPLERSKYAAFVYAGCSFGTVISLPLAGWLCSFNNGWPLAFYIFGFSGIIWFIFWMKYAYDTPQLHPLISNQELRYIEYATRKKHDEIIEKDTCIRDKVPWMSFASSLPLWAILISQCGQVWTFYTILTELPTYMDRILHVNIKQNSILSALPYLSTWICSICVSFIADLLLAKGWISQTNSNKLWSSVSSIGPSLGLLGVSWAGCDTVWVVIMLGVAGGFHGANCAGNSMNHIALSPKYAGTMMGITNAAANICGFLAPYIIGTIINGNETMSQWRIVFFLPIIINSCSNLFYLIFASAEEQSWSKGSRLSD